MDKNSANKISFRTSLVGHDLHWFGKSLHTLDKNSANRIRFRTSPVRRDQNLGRRRFYALNKNGANRIRFRTSPVRRDQNLGRRRFHALDKTVRTKSAFAPRRWGVSGTWGDGRLRYIRKTKRRKTASALPVWRHGRIPGWRRFSREKNRGNQAAHLAGEMPPGIGVTGWVALGRGFLPGSDWIYIAGGIYLAKTMGDVSMGRRPCR